MYRMSTIDRHASIFIAQITFITISPYLVHISCGCQTPPLFLSLIHRTVAWSFLKDEAYLRPPLLLLQVVLPLHHQVVIARALGLLDQNLLMSGLPCVHMVLEPPYYCLHAQYFRACWRITIWKTMDRSSFQWSSQTLVIPSTAIEQNDRLPLPQDRCIAAMARLQDPATTTATGGHTWYFQTGVWRHFYETSFHILIE